MTVLGNRTLYQTKFNPILVPERGLQKKNKIMPLKYSHFILKEDEQRVGEVISYHLMIPCIHILIHDTMEEL